MSSSTKFNQVPDGARIKKPKEKVKIIGHSCVMKPPQSEITQDEVRCEKIGSGTDMITVITPDVKRSQQVPTQKYKNDQVPALPVATTQRKSSLRQKSEKQSNPQEDTTATSPAIMPLMDTRGHLVTDDLFESSTSPRQEKQGTEWHRPVDVFPEDGFYDETPTIYVDRGTVSEIGSIRTKKAPMSVVKKLFGVHPSRFGMDTAEAFVFGESATEDDSGEDRASHNISSAQRDSMVSFSSLSAKRAAGIARSYSTIYFIYALVYYRLLFCRSIL